MLGRDRILAGQAELQMAQDHADTRAVETLHHDGDQVVDHCINDHAPTDFDAVPKKEQETGQDHQPVANFCSAGLFQPALDRFDVEIGQVLDAEPIRVKPAAVGDPLLPRAYVEDAFVDLSAFFPFESLKPALFGVDAIQGDSRTQKAD